MVTRELVRKAWSDAGLYKSRRPQLREFLKYFDKHPTVCWEALAPVFREHYYALYDLVVPPLVTSPDPMLRLQTIHQLEPARPQELQTLKDIAAGADPATQQPELIALRSLNHREINQQLRRRRKVARLLAAPVEPVRRPMTNVLRPPPGKKQQ
jgi:hypothetical protein